MKYTAKVARDGEGSHDVLNERNEIVYRFTPVEIRVRGEQKEEVTWKGQTFTREYINGSAAQAAQAYANKRTGDEDPETQRQLEERRKANERSRLISRCIDSSLGGMLPTIQKEFERIWKPSKNQPYNVGYVITHYAEQVMFLAHLEELVTPLVDAWARLQRWQRGEFQASTATSSYRREEDDKHEKEMLEKYAGKSSAEIAAEFKTWIDEQIQSITRRLLTEVPEPRSTSTMSNLSEIQKQKARQVFLVNIKRINGESFDTLNATEEERKDIGLYGFSLSTW